MSEKLEAELTEMDSKTDHHMLTEESNVDEAIPIGLRKEQITQAYKYTMSMDIDNIDMFETRNKVNTIKWSSIYEDIDKAYFKSSKFFSEDFMQEFKDN